MADWNGFKKNGTTYIPNDATARASISTIESKIPNGTTSSNPLVNQSTMENALDGKADVGDVISLAESVSDIEDKIPSNASSSNQLATRSEVSAAYKPKGNATLATLPPLTTANLNNVYNMTEDFTTTADFVEGAGKEVKAGNEVGIINIAKDPDALVIKYTVLGGFIDLSEYATQASVTSALADKVDKVTGKGLSTNDYDNTAKGIVDNIQSNVIANTKLIKDTVGWSGENEFDIAHNNKHDNATVQNYGFVNTVADTKSLFDAKVWYWNGSTLIDSVAIKNGGINETGHYEKEITIPVDITNLRFGHNGSQQNAFVEVPWTKTGKYIISFDVLAYNPSTIGGLDVRNIMVRKADILDGTFEPYFGSTAFPRSEQAVLGARQWLDKSKAVADSGVLLEQVATGVRVYNTTAKTYAAVRIPVSFKSNTDYKIKTDVDYTSGLGHISLQYSDDGSTWGTIIDVPQDITTDKSMEVDFNSGSHAYYRLALYSTRGISATGDVSYKNLIIVLASDDTTAYSDYAMTNRELTEKHNIKDVTIIAGTGIDIRPATSAKIEDKLLVAYLLLKNDTANDMPKNTVCCTLSGVKVHHGNNYVLPAIITDTMTNGAVLVSHNNSNNTMEFKNQIVIPAGQTLAISLVEYMINA